MPESNPISVRLLLVEDARVLQKIELRSLQSLGHRLAHFCAGSSASFGMTALAAPLRTLEQLAHGGTLANAPDLMVQNPF